MKLQCASDQENEISFGDLCRLVSPGKTNLSWSKHVVHVCVCSVGNLGAWKP